LQDRNLLVTASYEPRIGKSIAEREATLSRQLGGLAEAIRLATIETADVLLDVLLYTDLNRYY
jgi:hypothetical protein